jgi:uncharacterized protein (TIGR04255 family)
VTDGERAAAHVHELPSRASVVDHCMNLGATRTAMARQRHLKRAPITEALVDIRATPPPDFDVATFDSARELLKAELPIAETQRGVHWQLRAESGQPVAPQAADVGVRGVVLRSEDGRRVAQFRLDGFTFNQLAPYPGWAQVIADARRYFDVYVERINPALMTRVAVRFINRMPSPPDVRRLRSRFLGVPEIPRGTPRDLVSYVQRTVTRDRKTGATVIVAQMLEAPDASGASALVLDIDSFVERDAGFDRDGIMRHLDLLRRIKNQVFFSFITERTAKEFE